MALVDPDTLAGPLEMLVSGARVSTVKLLVALAGEALPAASTAMALTLCVPSMSAVGCEHEKVPPAVASAEQANTPSTLTLTVLLGSAMPL